ncbi:hypothetical protein NC652_012472 [Populus alba x Populus x berolinensis]|nr:hypothetical protein NC652_012472 [Populus alba x Populus x berolinensis]
MANLHLHPQPPRTSYPSTFTLYKQENHKQKPVYLIVKGVTGPDVSPVRIPFCSMFVNHDLLTISPNSSSKVCWSARSSFHNIASLGWTHHRCYGEDHFRTEALLRIGLRAWNC